MDFLTLGTAVLATKPFEVGGMAAVKLAGKTIVTTMASDATAYTVGYLSNQAGAPLAITMLLSMGSGIAVTKVAGKYFFKNAAGELLGECNVPGENMEGLKSSPNVIKGGLETESEIADQLSNQIVINARNEEKKVTSFMKSLEVDGTHLEGLDFRLKSSESLSRKILSDSHIKGISLDEAAADIGDSLRYTLVADEANYTKVVESSLANLQGEGYTISKAKNFWGEDLYQGINVSLKTPDGFTMELQFHTEASYYTKEVINHSYYEIARSETASISEIVEANEKMIKNQAKVKIPNGADAITTTKEIKFETL